MLKIGKLYCVRETPLTVLNRWGAEPELAELRSVVGYIDTCVPFLILEMQGTKLQVLFENKTGWTMIDPKNTVVEIV